MTMMEVAPRSQAEQIRLPERYELPRIIAEYPDDMAMDSLPPALRPASITKVSIEDPYVKYLEATDPDLLERIVADERFADADAGRRRARGQWSRRPDTVYQTKDGEWKQKGDKVWGDPEASEAFFGPDGVNDLALRIWRKYIPGASALEPLTNPFGTMEIIDPDTGISVPTTPLTRAWFAASTIPIGIRNRGAILAMNMAEAAADWQEEHPDEPFDFMSVACGTTLPTMLGAIAAGVPDALVRQVDLDEPTMARGAVLAKEIKFTGELRKHLMNVFSRRSIARLEHELTADGVDRRPKFIDKAGIYEYANEKLRPADYTNKNSLLYEPAEFLREWFNVLAPGGRLSFSQLLSSGPMGDFMMGVVPWPTVARRSLREVMQFVVDGGINPDWVNLKQTPEGMHVIGSIDKPEAASVADDGTYHPPHCIPKPAGRELSTATNGGLQRAAGICACRSKIVF
jgi:hypothetical protein